MSVFVASISLIRQSTAERLSLEWLNENTRLTDNTALFYHPNCSCRYRHEAITQESQSETFPTVSPDKKLILFADCRLDNRSELIGSLAPSKKQQTTDPELILAAYQKWGEHFVNQLKGDYSLVLVDTLTGKAFFVVDPLGKKHLFWKEQDGQIFVSNQLVQLAPKRSTLNQKAIHSLIFRQNSFSQLSPNSTWYDNIYLVPPGCVVKWLGSEDRHHLQSRIYWSPENIKKINLTPAQEPEVIEHYRDLFRQAVKRRLRTHDPVCSHLSGGFDSSSVASVAAEYCENAPLHCFMHTTESASININHSHWSNSESQYVEALLAIRPNIKLSMIEKRHFKTLDLIQMQLEHSASFFLNFDNADYLTTIAQHASEQGAKVILTGEKGNLGFSYHGSAPKSPLKRLRRSLRQLLGRTKAEHYLYPAVSRNTQAYYRHHLAKSIRSFKQGQRLQSHPHCDSAAFLKNYAGIEHWDPTADIDLISFILSLPDNMFYRNGQDRYLARKGCAAWLPEEIYHRESIGLQSADMLIHFQQQKHQIMQYIQRYKNEASYFDWAWVEHQFHQLINAPSQQLDPNNLIAINGIYTALSICALENYANKN